MQRQLFGGSNFGIEARLGHGLSDGFRPEISVYRFATHQARIGRNKIGFNSVERYVGKRAAIVQVFHMPSADAVDRLKQRVRLSVELQRLETDFDRTAPYRKPGSL